VVQAVLSGSGYALLPAWARRLTWRAGLDNVAPFMGNIESTIQSYFGALEQDEHHRYRSWEHCYRYFQGMGPSGLAKDRHHAAIQLGFFLASWGMYRGGSFLFQRAYTAHLPAVDCLCDPRWAPMWDNEFGSRADDEGKINTVLELKECLCASYSPFGTPTDILATKIMLGTLCCSPACDRYFTAGFKSEGHSFSYFNRAFVTRVLQFARKNLIALQQAQGKIEKSVGIRYPLMKLVDMYFFQTGLQLSGVDASDPEVM
jgi:hypothetical protein